MKKPESNPRVDYRELDQYLGVMFKLLEGFVEVEEAERSLESYLQEMGDKVPLDIKTMMRELLEEKRKKEALNLIKGTGTVWFDNVTLTYEEKIEN